MAPTAAAQGSPPDCDPYYYEDPESGECVYFYEEFPAARGARKRR
jgi:hypothetical protein